MILQTNAEAGARAFLNGLGIPGEMITLRVSGNASPYGSQYAVEADANGAWKVQLYPSSSTDEHEITVSGSNSSNTVVARHVMFGDVFFCSGQSNMVFPMGIVTNASAEMATLQQFPNFHFFMTSRSFSSVPLWDFPDQPMACDDGSGHKAGQAGSMCNRWVPQEEAMRAREPKTITMAKYNPNITNSFLARFSAVCYLTVRDMAQLHTAVGSSRPVGLIQSAWGGTRVEAWMSTQAIEDTKFAASVPRRTQQNNASVLFNAMINPWATFVVRAALWYQGEANADEKMLDVDQQTYYAAMYQSLIRDWRQRKGTGDFAFGTIQLPPSVPSTTPLPTQMDTGRMQIRLAEAKRDLIDSVSRISRRWP